MLDRARDSVRTMLETRDFAALTRATPVE